MCWLETSHSFIYIQGEKITQKCGFKEKRILWGHPSIYQSELLKDLAFVCLEQARDSATFGHLILTYKMGVNTKPDTALRNKMR